jgi:hypothetical protein
MSITKISPDGIAIDVLAGCDIDRITSLYDDTRVTIINNTVLN